MAFDFGQYEGQTCTQTYPCKICSISPLFATSGFLARPRARGVEAGEGERRRIRDSNGDVRGRCRLSERARLLLRICDFARAFCFLDSRHYCLIDIHADFGGRARELEAADATVAPSWHACSSRRLHNEQIFAKITNLCQYLH